MAAMFASFAVVFKVFLNNENTNTQTVASNIQPEEQSMVEDALIAPINDYDMFMYLYAESEN
jgi:hypothetical protein